MKKIVFILLVFTACKKSSDSNSVTVQVKEPITGQPVPGASVSLRRCAALGCAFGTVDEFKGTTDNNGTVNVPADTYNNLQDWNEAMWVSKSNYFGQLSSKSTSVSIIPFGWIRVRIISATNYPPGYKLSFLISSQSQPPYVDLLQFNVAADSTILLRGFGNQLNRVDWQVIDNSSSLVKNGTWSQQVPRLDTVKNILLNY